MASASICTFYPMWALHLFLRQNDQYDYSPINSIQSGMTLGLGVGPGEPLPVLLILHPPFLLADGGVLQRAPALALALCLSAVCMRAGGLLSPGLCVCDVTDAILSSPSKPISLRADNLQSSSRCFCEC